MAADAYTNGKDSYYPLTKMNFLVTVASVAGTAAFSEVSGVEASVDVIEFRQGNAGSLAPVKIPGLVKHGNVISAPVFQSHFIAECFDTAAYVEIGEIYDIFEFERSSH